MNAEQILVTVGATNYRGHYHLWRRHYHSVASRRIPIIRSARFFMDAGVNNYTKMSTDCPLFEDFRNRKLPNSATV